MCSIVPASCIPVKFKAYTDTQLQKIITFKAFKELIPENKLKADADTQRERSAFLTLLQDCLPPLVTGTRVSFVCSCHSIPNS